MNNLADIQSKVKAPKGQMNKFGNYRYRSAEDIVEAVKLVINPMGFYLTLSDEMVMLGTRFYIKATARISNTEGEHYEAVGWAREEEVKKGMDGSQITGAASSYARKYALNGLFAIDDTKDSDATNTHDKEEPDDEIDEIGDVGRDELLKLLETSTYETKVVKALKASIGFKRTLSEYNEAKAKLLANQVDINGVINPSQDDINKTVRKIAKQPV